MKAKGRLGRKMHTVRKTLFLAAIAVSASLGLLPGAVRAGTLPNITGTWYANGDTSKRCEISQSGTSVTLRNEQGRTANGRFTDPGTIDTDWGYFGGSHITGAISPDLRRITWSNGTYWTRESAPQPTPTPNPYRELRFVTANLAPARGPIAVFGGWAAVKRDGKAAVVCVSFKNVQQVAATRVVIDFPLESRSGETVETLHLDRRGTFSPDVDIRGWGGLASWQSGLGHRGYADNCATQSSGIAALSLMHAHLASYRIERVEFADGSVWPSP